MVVERRMRQAPSLAASWLRRPEARHVIGAGSVIVTTGDGIGLRSGGFEPSRNPPARTLIQGVAQPCLGLAASILSVLRRSDRLVRPLPGRRGACGSRPRRGGRRCHHRVPSCTPRRASSRLPLEGCSFFLHEKVATPFGSHGFPRFPSRGGPAIGAFGGTIKRQSSDTFRPSKRN